ncbi:hypothetical protein niasHT_010098 [Heterodera trifolii]|uniref:RNA-dependent RNA polymerase n=1 Tax=Heterodera trifolii TaxID=157864 RepID=A0ABD2LW81_9BILA
MGHATACFIRRTTSVDRPSDDSQNPSIVAGDIRMFTAVDIQALISVHMVVFSRYGPRPHTDEIADEFAVHPKLRLDIEELKHEQKDEEPSDDSQNPSIVAGDIRMFTAVDIPALISVHMVVFSRYGPRPHTDEIADEFAVHPKLRLDIEELKHEQKDEDLWRYMKWDMPPHVSSDERQVLTGPVMITKNPSIVAGDIRMSLQWTSRL